MDKSFFNNKTIFTSIKLQWVLNLAIRMLAVNTPTRGGVLGNLRGVGSDRDQVGPQIDSRIDSKSAYMINGTLN